MKHAVILALVAAAAVSAHEYKSYASKTYGGNVLVSYEHYDCDATSHSCYAPKSYGGDYQAKSYSYKRSHAYPGPKARFCAKLKRLGAFIGGIINKVIKGFKHTWVHFKKHWHEHCAIIKSDWERFEDWKSCEAKKFKDWWGYHQDLCRTRKQLWDDAMREFHRQWCHYKKSLKEKYEERKKACGVHDKDYDDDSKYHGKLNHYGVTPVEDHYNNYSTGGKYKPDEYKKTCDARDAKYSAKNNGDLGMGVGTLPGETTPVAGGPPTPVAG
jgi:hypothetical protein